MRRVPLRAAVVVLASTAMLFGAACGTDAPEGTAASEIDQLPEDLLQDTYLGLRPQREDLSGSLGNQDANAYIDAVGLYSLRNDKRLEATLQISKLSDNARPNDPEFQQLVADQIGGTKAQSFVMDGRNVYRSSQRKQSLSSWFRGDYFLILSVRETYKEPRALLRLLLEEVNP